MAAKIPYHRSILLAVLVVILLPILVLLLLSGLSINFISTYKAELPRHFFKSSIIVTLAAAALFFYSPYLVYLLWCIPNFKIEHTVTGDFETAETSNQ